ncbi:hypothetical protein FB645_006300 [Coemansia sp. IMI 203386]|nr:hypothetical protein FB645_006300 [Coemansia sp. IMI 203386]
MDAKHAGQLPVAAYTPSQLTELFRLEKQLVERRAQTDRQRAALELTRRLEQQLSLQQQRIKRKQQQVSSRAYLVEQASTLVDHRLARHTERRRLTNQASVAIEKSRDLVSRQAVALRQERIILEDLRAMLAKERSAKMTQVMEIFDISTDDSGVWCLCGGMRVGGEGEMAAAGLGAVCRVLDLAARYVAVPLRFPVVPRGSRSAVCVVNGSGIVELVPLFVTRRGDRFVLAKKALAADIGQLLWIHGIDCGDDALLLPGLLQLLMAVESSSFAT